MENLSKTESLRQALNILGESTAQELSNYTGIPLIRIGALLKNDINNGFCARSWKGKERSYRRVYPASALPKTRRKTNALYELQPSWDPVPIEPYDYEPFELLKIVQAASMHEKQQQYETAVSLWLKAKSMARQAVNVEYYHRRAQYCMVAIERRWGTEDAA